MLIGELAEVTGTSARALRHYEDRGLLVPARNTSGYRTYAESDVIRVAQIRTMISAGLGTSAIRRYLDCASTDEHGTTLEMCPDLQAELDALALRLHDRQAQLRDTQRRLAMLAPGRGRRATSGSRPGDTSTSGRYPPETSRQNGCPAGSAST